MQRVYRGREGMISWALHRLTGLGVLLFLLIHIADIYVIGYGPEEFDSLLFIYHSLGFRLMEVMLVAALYYHAINGVRIILIDFWEGAVLIHELDVMRHPGLDHDRATLRYHERAGWLFIETISDAAPLHAQQPPYAGLDAVR